MKSIFEFREYRPYLLSLESSRPKGGWGFRSELAKALNCQSAYVSRIFNGQTHLSLEQAETLSRYVGLTEEEADFLVLLVGQARAGSIALRSRFSRQIAVARERRLMLKDRFKIKPKLSRDDQAIYYSSWHYAAVHLILSIPHCQTKELISARLGLSPSRTAEVLSFLVSVGLAKEDRGKYRIGEARIHLGADSPLIGKHHTNWRMQAIRSLDNGGENQDLHYSSVVTLSREDYLQVKATLVKAIEAANETVARSPEEEIACISLDLFYLCGSVAG